MGDVVIAGAARRAGLAGLVLAVVWSMGCGDDDGLTELVVVIDSDMAVPAELSLVHLRVVGPSGDAALDENVDLAAPGAPSLPLTLSLTPGSDALSPVLLTATGTAQGGTVERTVDTGFVRGERRMVAIWLLEACVGVTCPAGQTCGAGGVCAAAAVPPDSLPPWTGDPDAGAPPDAGTDAEPATDADTATDAEPATDAATDAATDTGTDAGTDAGGCVLDTDCPDDDVGDCIGLCMNDFDHCSTSGQTCQADVTKYNCDDGQCIFVVDTETVDCSEPTDGRPCGGPCMCEAGLCTVEGEEEPGELCPMPVE
jgi:hypothetical protein